LKITLKEVRHGRATLDLDTTFQVEVPVQVLVRELGTNGFNALKEDGVLEVASSDAVSVDPLVLRTLGAVSGTGFSLLQRLQFFASDLDMSRLKPFQFQGIDFLKSEKGCILADDMGLGKSAQSILASMQLMREGEVTRVLIISPKSLVFNWLQELGKWAPDLCASVVLPRGQINQTFWDRRVAESQVIVVSYEAFREHGKALSGSVELIIADEAHRLKNAHSIQSRQFSRFDAKYKWLLTGTPLERDVSDMTTLLSLVLPKRFSSSARGTDPLILRQRARPYILRRSKSEVAADLPQMTEIEEILNLTDHQKVAYQRAVNRPGVFALQQFSELRSITDLDTETGSSAKIDRTIELIHQIAAQGDRMIVFSFWTEILLALRERIKRDASLVTVYYLNADLSALQRTELIDNWRKDESGVLLASAHIAAEGLTLTEANYVIFLTGLVKIGRHSRFHSGPQERLRTQSQDCTDRKIPSKQWLLDGLKSRNARGSRDGDIH
jgi:SNF2 family DNA or RNA helicase